MDEDKKNLTRIKIQEAMDGKDLDDLLQNTLPLEPVHGLILSKLGDMSIDKLGIEIGLSHNGIYKIIGGKSRPERDTLLSVAFVLHMTVDETQQLLKSGHRSLLTGREKRDIVLIYGLSNGFKIDEIDELLDQYQLKLLVPKK